MIPAYILTSPREKNTLSRTINCLFNAGFTSLGLYNDSDKAGPGVAHQSMRKYIASLAIDGPVLTCEDDIITCTNLHEYCEALTGELKEDVAMISLWMATSNRKRDFTDHHDTLVRWTRTECFHGGLCWLWNPKALKEIAGFADAEEREVPWGVETFVVRWANRRGYQILMHQPSLVQHADEQSPTNKIDVKYPAPYRKDISTYEQYVDQFRSEEFLSGRYSDTFVGENDFLEGVLKNA